MEEFAAEIADAGTAEGISQMFDQYLNFVVGEPDLYSLGMGGDAYWALNSAQTKDEEIDALVDRAVSGLFSVVVTIGTSRTLKVKDNGRLQSSDHRFNTNHTVAQRRACGNDRGKTGSKIARSYPEFEGQPIFPASICGIGAIVKTNTRHCGSDS